jgi:hypothetical protein
MRGGGPAGSILAPRCLATQAPMLAEYFSIRLEAARPQPAAGCDAPTGAAASASGASGASADASGAAASAAPAAGALELCGLPALLEACEAPCGTAPPGAGRGPGTARASSRPPPTTLASP